MSNLDLAIVYGLLVIPVGIALRYGVPDIQETIWAVLRMTVQLALVGLYLQLLFRLDNLVLTLGWILVMLLVADLNILKKSALPRRFGVVLPLLGSTMIAIVIPTAVLIIAAGPEPWYTARYVVPLAGMVLGNSLRGNIIALDTFRHTLETERELYAARLFSGATPAEAMRPVIARSLAKSLAPTIATTATIGLVSLPGMMTGQILGGAVPFTAIRYQIAIMLAIFASVSLAAVLNIVTARHLFFDQFDMPCFD
ncbi:MAG: ABC transporter permease [Alkalispirochaeta sp.]